jgi:hypothetical protein
MIMERMILLSKERKVSQHKKRKKVIVCQEKECGRWVYSPEALEEHKKNKHSDKAQP